MMSFNRLKCLCAACIFLLWALISCGPDDGSGTVIKGVRFFSIQNPGPWQEQADDHEPVITIQRTDEGKSLIVRVPFAEKVDRRHIVEAIVVLDLKGKEIRKMSFPRGKAASSAKFDFADNYNEPVHVVIKCNLHDMWIKRVDWSEDE